MSSLRLVSYGLMIVLASITAYDLYLFGILSLNILMITCTASFLLVNYFMKNILAWLPFLLVFYLLVISSHTWGLSDLQDDFLIAAILLPAMFYDAEAFRKITTGE